MDRMWLEYNKSKGSRIAKVIIKCEDNKSSFKTLWILFHL